MNYAQNGGNQSSELQQELTAHLNEDLLVLSSTGLANSLIFREKQKNLATLDEEDDNMYAEKTVKVVTQDANTAHSIQRTIKNRSKHWNHQQQCRLNTDNTCYNIRQTDLDTVIMTGNIVIASITNTSTSLLAALDVLVRQKDLLQTIYG